MDFCYKNYDVLVDLITDGPDLPFSFFSGAGSFKCRGPQTLAGLDWMVFFKSTENCIHVRCNDSMAGAVTRRVKEDSQVETLWLCAVYQ